MQIVFSRPFSIKFDRLLQLLCLAVTVLIYSVLGMAIANSLFVSKVGAQQLPFAFALIGLCSMPAYLIFSQLVDRYSRTKLFRYVLIGSVPVILGLRFVLNYDSPYLYYLLLIAIFFQWDFHNNVLYPSLLTDYFSTLEYKRYAPNIGIAQAVGTLLGGALTTLLSHYFATKDLLFYLPIFYVLGIFQLLYLERSQRQLAQPNQSSESVGLWESIRTFPELVKRYPLSLFLASSSFLLVIIYISSEFLWFNIYGDNFSDQALTGFLGLMRIVISLIQVVVIYGATRPLLEILGVARLNPVYPLTTLTSFGILLSSFGLPAAIALHINGDAFYKAINLPIHQLNYNAIPREFVGRIRALSDGLIYAIGLTLAGVVLWLGEMYLDLQQMAWFVAGLTLIFLAVRLPMGRFYANGLEEMIRSDSIDLDAFDLDPIPLNAQSNEAIRELLKEGDRYSQLKGLELARRLDQPEQFLPEVETLLSPNTATDDPQLYSAAIALFTDCSETVQQSLEKRLENPDWQAFALEILLINRFIPSPKQIQDWLNHSSPEMQTLGAIAELQQWDKLPKDWGKELNEVTARIMTRVVATSNNPIFAPLIPNVVLTQTDPDIIRTGLEALLPLTQKGDQETASIAHSKLSHFEPMVRIAALDLLQEARCPEFVEAIAHSLEDPEPRVRERSAKTLASYGRQGIDAAQPSLQNLRPEIVNAAITAIGAVKTRYASDILFRYLEPNYKLLEQTRKWQADLPDSPELKVLQVAIQDYGDRLTQKVLFVLAALGYAPTVNVINRLLATNAQAELENAIEFLTSLNHRRFVTPLLPKLKALVEQDEPTRETTSTHITPKWLREKGYRLLLEAMESGDRWIKIGALIALEMVPSVLANDPDPFVKQVAGQLFETHVPAKTAMNRLLLLKTVKLFRNLSLDELMLIDDGLEQTQVLAETAIFDEGGQAAYLYIIAEGTVQLRKKIDGTPRTTKQLTIGDYFGEVALFDDAPLWDGAIAQTDCTLLKLEKNRFLSLITQRPHIILEICRFLSQRLRETDKLRSPESSNILQ
ncbi:putative transcriptional regulator, Crp/Fnr family [[Leptolyngbya] sp. PCC 7376]|uniref:cyclic nucleotide-binding domain-containing protein n=1 Tax=[Leptolyngbya] sp. PCC 7376 TaxID=111781 RepID=UPI00029EC3C9|nr:cyclic nucleotide-binding domain-containing protein [[Leptolyngbya] sp. PCC 7376]AFY39419.1 putative transcriptional regulator, Crp/Fnr family [[Leptolyngbya] sp. PCC 7376]